MNNVDKQYQELLTKILDKGRQKGDRTGTGTISIPFAAVEFDMSEGFPLLTTKKVFTKAIVHELLWFLKGDTDVKGLEQHNVSIWTSDAYREYTKEWMKINPPMSGPYTEKMLTKEEFTLNLRDPSTKGWDLGPVYGAQWRRWKSYDKHRQSPEEFDDVIYIDQIQQVMDKLINNPDDRRIMVSAWNVAEIDKMALPPCHYGFQLYSEELTTQERFNYGLDVLGYNGLLDAQTDEDTISLLDGFNVPKRRLSLIWDQRSCDTFLGIPFNIASYGILLHMFAQQANMVPDRLIGSLKNVHVYNNHVDQCKEQIAREPRKLPRIVLNKAKDIFSYTYDDIQILDYNPHDKITGAISV
jgi:thymidylate synthase